MKKHLCNVYSALFSCLVLLLLGSCENFLTGIDLRAQVIDAIEIANSQPQVYSVIIDEGSGKVTPEFVRVKKNESFSVMFNPSSEWRFVCWEAIDKKTGTVLPDAAVFEDPSSSETTVRILTPRENLAIHPRCYQIPAVEKVYPSSETVQSAYIPIEITFNRSMVENNNAADDTIFNFQNISLMYNETDMSSFFEQPYFSPGTNNKVLVIRPKARALQAYIKAKKISSLQINFTLSEKIYVLYNKTPLYLTQNQNNSFKVSYFKELDELPPEKGSEGYFYVSRESDSKPDDDNLFYQKVDLSNETEIKTNRTTGTVYIYGKYSDADSGIKSVIIRERRTNSITGVNESTLEPVTTEYTANSTGAVFSKQGQYTVFCIEHQISSEHPGKILLNATVCDYCDNCSETEELSAIYTNSDNFYFKIYNAGPFCNNTGMGTTYILNTMDSSYFKTLRISTKNPTGVSGYEAYETIYSTYKLSGSELTMKYSYIDKNKTLQEGFMKDSPSEDGTGNERIVELNVDSLKGLTVHITVSDDINNKMECDVTFPLAPDFFVTERQTDKVEIDFAKESGYYGYEMYKGTDNDEKWKFLASTKHTINKGTNYQACSINSIFPFFIIGEPGPVYNYESFSIQGTVPPVELKSNVAELSKGILARFGVAYLQQTDITVYLKDDNWLDNKYDLIYLYFLYTVEGSSSQRTYKFPYGTPKLTISESTSELKKYTDYSIQIVGSKNGNLSEPVPVTIPELKGKELDNLLPQISYTYKNYDVLELTFSDSISCPKTLSLLSPEGKKYMLYDNPDNTESSVKLTEFPAWFILEEQTQARFIQFEGSDIADNSGIIKANGAKSLDVTLTPSYVSSNKWKFTAANSTELYVYTWNLSNNCWNEPVEGWSSGNYTIQNNSFVKVIPVHLGGFSGEWVEMDTSGPQYFYMNTSTIQSQPENKYIIPANSQDSLYIDSDCDALIWTVGTKKSFAECSLWTEKQWKFRHFETGAAVYKYSSANRTQQLYTIPVDEVQAAGCNCYVVLVQFADGTMAKSEVFEL